MQAKHLAYEIDLKSEWLTGDKLKVAPKNSQVASPFIDGQDPRPSETSDVTDTVSSESGDEVVIEGDNIVDQPPRYNRRYNLRPNHIRRSCIPSRRVLGKSCYLKILPIEAPYKL